MPLQVVTTPQPKIPINSVLEDRAGGGRGVKATEKKYCKTIQICNAIKSRLDQLQRLAGTGQEEVDKQKQKTKKHCKMIPIRHAIMQNPCQLQRRLRRLFPDMEFCKLDVGFATFCVDPSCLFMPRCAIIR
mmetsp:Transcript_28834/g.50950  ORF Transcript_28834/g.50950 Transcript_28834/m.50950 type:complete len:131 (-) Transcript_28834:560-952(-)